jgi:hypothetical protein
MGAMPWLSFAELDARAARFDALVATTPEIDLFCSSTSRSAERPPSLAR